MDDSFKSLWTLISNLIFYLTLAITAFGDYLTSTKLTRLRLEHQLSHQNFNELDCAFCIYHRDVIYPSDLRSQPWGNDEVDNRM